MRRTYKKILLVLMAAAVLFLLSACSFSDMMSWGTGVKEDPDYQTWEKLSENGKLDEEGIYTADAVHVTFAESSFFDMKYYRDPELQEELSADGCYLFPGDMIYSTSSLRNDVGNYYAFDHLDVVEYSADNVRGGKLDWKYQDNPTVLMIPYNYKGSEVAIEPVGHYKLITVILEQPEIGGVVHYSVNDQELTGETAELYKGAKIKGTLEEDTGWEMQLNQNPSYVVTEEENQIVTFEGKRANEFFSEVDDHKPAMKVELNRNLKSCRMTIETDGYSKKDITAGNGGVVIENQQIGTKNGIHVTFSHFDLENGKNAVRLVVLKKTENTEYKEIHYANEANNSIQIDFEYEVTYKNITLTAEAVEAFEFQPVTDDNAEIIAKFCDQELDNKKKDIPLTAGTLSTKDRQINVQIIPHDTYSMIGSFTNEGTYHRQMRFDEYDRFVKEALQNQMKKVCTIQLDANDPYGTVVYKVDGKEATGEQKILEGKSITINYTLTNDKYRIDEDRNIFDQINVFDAGRFEKYEKTITIDRSMDGQTLNRESFIKISEKVN